MSVFSSKHGSKAERGNGIFVSDNLANESRLTAKTGIVLLLLKIARFQPVCGFKQ